MAVEEEVPMEDEADHVGEDVVEVELEVEASKWLLRLPLLFPSKSKIVSK